MRTKGVGHKMPSPNSADQPIIIEFQEFKDSTEDATHAVFLVSNTTAQGYWYWVQTGVAPSPSLDWWQGGKWEPFIRPEFHYPSSLIQLGPHQTFKLNAWLYKTNLFQRVGLPMSLRSNDNWQFFWSEKIKLPD